MYALLFVASFFAAAISGAAGFGGAVVMHITKSIIYQKYLDIGMQVIEIGIFMATAMIAGIWDGKKAINNMDWDSFSKFVGVLLIIVGLQMTIWG